MKGFIGLVTIVIVAAGLAGCTGSASSGPPTGDTTAMSAPSADHLVAMETPPWARDAIGTRAPVITTPGNTSMPWRLVTLSADGRSLSLVWVAGGGCTTFDGLLVEETPSTVTITVSGTTDWRAQACAAYLSTGAGTVSLASPLGGRTLWHAPIHKRWEAPGSTLGEG